MAKYYVQSGKVSFIVAACDVEGAALWAMHRTMDEKICDHEEYNRENETVLQSQADPFQIPVSAESLSDSPRAIPYEAMLDGLSEFDEMICVSQRGMGRDDAGELQTEEIFHQWRQLMLAVDRLHDNFG